MSDKPLTDVTFSSFDLHPALIAGLEAAGFTRCTPIQALTLPLALNGRDVAGQAQTGTGKTLAFLVAVVDRLLKRPALADRKAALEGAALDARLAAETVDLSLPAPETPRGSVHPVSQDQNSASLSGSAESRGSAAMGPVSAPSSIQ